MNIKKTFVLSTLLLVNVGVLQADDFEWSQYKKTLPNSIIESNDLTKSEETKKNIKKHYGVNVERRTLSEIKRDQTTKNLTVSAILKNTETFLIPGTTTESKTSAFGVGIIAKFDLLSIGKKYKNTYAHIDVFQDNIWMGFSRRIQSENRLGLFSDVGGGLFFQTQETVRQKDMYLYGFVRLGYNFEDWNVKLGVNIPSDSIDNGFLNSTQFNFSVGMRF